MIRNILAAGILSLMVAALSGALTYRYLQEQFTEERIQLLTQVEQLTLQKAQLEEAVVALQQQQECGELNAEPAHATVRYTNTARGIAIDLPYNESWGYGETIPKAYQELSGVDGVLFGPPREADLCQWAHTYQLTFVPARTAEEIKTDVAFRNQDRIADGSVSEEDIEVVSLTINDLTVYSYEVPGYCISNNLEIPGEEYNYIFTACAEDADGLESIVAAAELL